ncbi:MAG TPA: cupredoxin domain-containing protein [Solirubrobacterales bacterium]|nr:cupredoxin domain-containing protein [Solirubrobacterales bacterium]
MIRTVALSGIAVAALGFGVVGCGSSSSSSSTTAASSTTTSAAAGGGGASGGGSSVNVSETEYKLNPSDPTVKAGQVTLNATNDGTVTHSLEVEGTSSGDQELQSELQPGQSGTLTVNLKPGKYEFYCPIDGHKDLGMKGEITVQ